MSCSLPPRGFTLLELMIATLLSSFLLLMIAGMWASLGRSAAGNLADCQIAADALMALDTFRRDLSGTLPGSSLGGKQQGRLVGRLIVGGNQLRLCYDGNPANGIADWGNPDRVVVYQLDAGRLVRTDVATGASFVVADSAEQFCVTDLGTGVRIALTLGRRRVCRTYTLVTRDP